MRFPSRPVSNWCHWSSEKLHSSSEISIANKFSRADFLAGQYFDIRLEVHQPVNGSEAIGLPLDEKFTFTIAKKDAAAKPVIDYFKIQDPKLEKWNFTYYEGG